MNIANIHNDYAVCCNRFYQLALYNNRISADLPDESGQIVVLVWFSLGIIGNHGFRYYFEGNFGEDPDCMKTMAGYKRIGALRSYRAFVHASGCFHGSKIPDDLVERRQIVSLIPRGNFNHADSLYQEAINEVVTCLAGFIRSHQWVHTNSLSYKDAAELAHAEIRNESFRI
jgi:Domain of unknown function (DUF4375)